MSLVTTALRANLRAAIEALPGVAALDIKVVENVHPKGVWAIPQDVAIGVADVKTKRVDGVEGGFALTGSGQMVTTLFSVCVKGNSPYDNVSPLTAEGGAEHIVGLLLDPTAGIRYPALNIGTAETGPVFLGLESKETVLHPDTAEGGGGSLAVALVFFTSDYQL